MGIVLYLLGVGTAVGLAFIIYAFVKVGSESDPDDIE